MKKTFFYFTLALFVAACLFGSALASDVSKQNLTLQQARKSITETILKADTKYRIVQEARERKERQEQFQTAIKQAVAKEQRSAAILQKVERQITPQDRMRLFFSEIKRLRAEGKSATEILSIIQQRQKLAKTHSTGVISGTITVDGAVPPGEVMVFAFDEYGYLNESALADISTGAYTIEDLDAGAYFVVTESPFVDEFYNDVKLMDFTNWRMAEKVTVHAGTTTSGIDFDLQKGVTIKGKVTQEDTGVPLPFMLLTIEVYAADDPYEPIQSEYVFTNLSGEYEFTLGELGTFFIYAEAPGFSGEFYNNQADLANATPVVVTDPSAEVTGVDFSLSIMTIEPPMPTGAKILGAVTSQVDGTPLNFVIVLAIDTADTSLAGFTLSGLFFGGIGMNKAAVPNYAIMGLDAGSYIVMATDLLGGYSREFYKESPTFEGATPVTVAENDTAMNIDFTLDMGGSISGTVVDEMGNPVPDIVVVALQIDLSNLTTIFTSIDLGFDSTDASGNYRITGLSTGDYMVRTFSLLGDMGGIYLDEWYQDVHSLLAFDQAMAVHVEEPNETAEINFQLEKAGFIHGRILNADGSAPVFDVDAVIVLDAATGFPQLGIFNYTGLQDGSYFINNLESGSYKLFAFVNPDAGNMFISEFYDGSPTLAGATPVEVTMGDTTNNIDFTLEQGGVIQGFVELSAGYPAGADTLFDFPVVVYEATTGKFAGAAPVTFSGGFRVTTLPAGEYKVSALPIMAPFAATYYGGGASFDASNALTVTVTPLDSQKITIVLNQAAGQISGKVTNAITGDPVDRVVVFAYDQTGHAVGAGMSGYILGTQIPTGQSGSYVIPNLASGSYFVRTFSLFGFIESLTNLDLGGEMGMDMLGSIGDLGGMFGPLFFDEWYDDVPVQLPELSMELVFELLRNLQYEIFGIFPFVQSVPNNATSVAVTDGSITGGIDFALGEFSLEGLRVSVDEKRETVPSAFVLSQSYPNPVRKSDLANGVQIQFQLPEKAHISVSIYNLLGQKIATLTEATLPAGSHRLLWNGLDTQGRLVPTGVYFYALETSNGNKQLKKMVILR